MNAKQKVSAILARADVAIDGVRPFDIQVKDDRTYRRVATHAILGLCEAYMDGWWECADLAECLSRLMRAGVGEEFRYHPSTVADFLRQKLRNPQSRDGATVVAKMHYDLDCDLFEKTLDKRVVYTCGYWKEAKTLDEAQEDKLDLVCRKIGLQKGQRVLDIGCGWGSFVKFAAEKYGAAAVGVTNSKEQAEYARKACAGLPVDIHLQDYRDIDEPFDHIISLEMFEHVGYKNYREFFEVCRRCLKDDGLLLLHTMGQWKSAPNLVQPEAAWINKYLFPNSHLPSIAQIGSATEDLFIMEDLHNMRADYEKTYLAWSRNFEKNSPQLKREYDPAFHRLWKLYLQSFAGAFRSGKYELWQIVFSKTGVRQGYAAVR